MKLIVLPIPSHELRGNSSSQTEVTNSLLDLRVKTNTMLII